MGDFSHTFEGFQIMLLLLALAVLSAEGTWDFTSFNLAFDGTRLRVSGGYGWSATITNDLRWRFAESITCDGVDTVQFGAIQDDGTTGLMAQTTYSCSNPPVGIQTCIFNSGPPPPTGAPDPGQTFAYSVSVSFGMPGCSPGCTNTPTFFVQADFDTGGITSGTLPYSYPVCGQE